MEYGNLLQPIPIMYKDFSEFRKALQKLVTEPNKSDTIKSKLNELLKDKDLEERFIEMQNLHVSKSTVISEIKSPFIMNLSTIILALILLPLSSTIHIYGSEYEMIPISQV
jgi:hypothetical protein